MSPYGRTTLLRCAVPRRIGRPVYSPGHHLAARQRRGLLTLAIESSCDDTCVAILEKDGPTARLHFNRKITCDNLEYRGVHPVVAVESHTRHLASLVQEALRSLPEPSSSSEGAAPVVHVQEQDGGAPRPRRRPDFVSVTRGPGMTANLSAGLMAAKGLAVAWQVPLVGANHMQAHALTPRMVSALERGASSSSPSPPSSSSLSPSFPFLTLLVSGGHTLLVLSRSLCDHEILAEADNIAIGDMLDKCARAVLPPGFIRSSSSSPGGSVVYGRLLESFAFPRGPTDYRYSPPARRSDELAAFDSGLGWALTPPLSESSAMRYDFSGLNGAVQKIVSASPSASREGGGEEGVSSMGAEERRLLGREAMRLAFEHLGSRAVMALKRLRKEEKAEQVCSGVRTLVVSGGVAANRFLMHVLRAMLDARGFGDVGIVAPPVEYCTDNAAMIAWTGMEMYEAGWRTELSVLPLRKWPVDPRSEGGGILGADSWISIKG